MHVAARLRLLLSRDDFRANPLQAIFKRALWRLRWTFRRDPWILTTEAGRRMALPKSGPGALVYYLGRSEPDTVDLYRRLLAPGMVVFDIGAHFGEFTLLASELVLPGGRVFAFEPHPLTASVLETNIQLAYAENVELVRSAVAERSGQVEFIIERESAESALQPMTGQIPSHHSRKIRIDATTVDDFMTARGLTRIDFLKVDVEGAEFAVFKGAQGAIGLPAHEAPIIWFEYNFGSLRYGHLPSDSLVWLRRRGYTVYRYHLGGAISPLEDDSQLQGTLCNLLATKAPMRSRAPGAIAIR
jgi:FkbM family methyltransferase